MSEPTSDVDYAVRTALQSNDPHVAATRALEAYGREIFTFLVARLRSQSDGEEAFSMFAEDFWNGLPSFAFRCSVRGWMYTIARNAANRYASSPSLRPARNLTLPGNESVSELVERVRTATEIHLRTDVKGKVRALRERLDPEDQTLLILHIDRGLPWRDLAMVMHSDGDRLDGEALERETVRLRKRFERVKAELKELAEREGLLK